MTDIYANKPKTETQVAAMLGNILREGFSKSEVDAWLLKYAGKDYKLTPKNRLTYNEKFGSASRETTEVADKPIMFIEKPFDLQLADYYVKKYRNAKERGIEFTLTLADLKKLLKKKTCFYTGELLTFAPSNNVFTLDRVDSSKGYTKENTVQCAAWVNQWKNQVLENTTSKTFITKENLFKILSKIS